MKWIYAGWTYSPARETGAGFFVTRRLLSFAVRGRQSNPRWAYWSPLRDTRKTRTSAEIQRNYMIETLISLIIYLVVVGLIWWAVTTVLGVIPLPEPIKTVVRVLLIVLLCLIVLYAVLPLVNHVPRLR